MIKYQVYYYHVITWALSAEGSLCSNTAPDRYYFRFRFPSRSIELHLLSLAKLGMGMLLVLLLKDDQKRSMSVLG